MRRALPASKSRPLAFGRGLLVAAAVAAVTLVGVLRAEAEPSGAGSAEEVLARVEANEADKALVKEPAARARSALERARRMRLAGDEGHARQADAVAREWALVAEALVRAAREEARAAAARKAALDAGTEAERERALLEQAIARAGRLQAELRQAQAEIDAGPPAPPPKAAAGAVDGGTKRPETAAGGPREMRLRAAFVVVLPVALGCGSPAPSPLFADLGRAREGAAAKEAQRLAPQAFGEAEAIRAEADRAWDSGDHVGGALLAERALAAYERAFVLARLARATEGAATAEADLAKSRSELASLAALRENAEREAAELEKKVVLARERLAPLPPGPADATREAARLVAARSLAMQARLLCGAAELAFPGAPGLEAQKRALAELDKQLAGKPKPAPIDAAGRARVGCLEVLTLARRAADRAQTTEPDALLAELSASGDLSPSRDERGVVVTLRDAFRGTALAPGVDAKVEALGRVAAAHAGVGVQVVLHDAAEPTSAADRAGPIVKRLVAGGAPEAKIRVELAGTALPVVDPADAKNRGRNARVEIVFVGR